MRKGKKNEFNPIYMTFPTGVGLTFGIIFDQLLWGLIIGAALGVILNSIVGYKEKDTEEKDISKD